MVEREAAVVQRPAVFVCPECPERFDRPEDLGTHLERHREVLPPAAPSPRGKPRSVACPKSCGRNFDIKERRDLAHHVALCDGSAPIVAVVDERKEEMVAKLECPKCGKKYQRGGKRYEDHVEACEGKEAAAAARRVRKPTPPPSASEPLIVTDTSGGALTPKQRVLNMLEVEEEQLAKQLGDVKRLIHVVRNCEESEGA